MCSLPSCRSTFLQIKVSVGKSSISCILLPVVHHKPKRSLFDFFLQTFYDCLARETDPLKLLLLFSYTNSANSFYNSATERVDSDMAGWTTSKRVDGLQLDVSATRKQAETERYRPTVGQLSFRRWHKIV